MAATFSDDSCQLVLHLDLEKGMDGSSTLYRLKKNWTLEFRLGPSLFGCDVRLRTNYPPPTVAYDRSTYYLLEWTDESDSNDSTAIFTRIHILLSGSFNFILQTADGQECCKGSFVVEPSLRVGHHDDLLPLDGVQCQTVITKCLGSFDRWREALKVAKECHYNMIHFTPLQELGSSDSSYSLASHHNLDSRYEAEWEDVSQLVKDMKNEWKMLSLCDLVLNHTANNSLWIREHPESTFNCWNSPHLRPAFLLDRLFLQVTHDIEAGTLIDAGIPRGELSTQQHLDIVRSILFDKYLPAIKLEEFFQANVEEMVQKFANARSSTTVSPSHDSSGKTFQLVIDPQWRRLGRTVNLEDACAIFGDDVNQFKMKLIELNTKAAEETWVDLYAAVDNVIKGAVYERLESGGPHITRCDARHPFARNYFRSVDESLEKLEKMMYEKQDSQQFMAHNGWVMGMDPTTNFASSTSKVYFRRELIAWGDSVKLNYGREREDCPFLWDYMRSYVERMATIFHGIRLDNCHSTPIHVAEYMLDAARKIRPDLYVIAELFTGSPELDNLFINRLGISSLIREALSAHSPYDQGRLVYRFGGEPVGSFVQPPVRKLVPSMAHAIFFDQTHDNPSPIEKRCVLDVLPTAALVNMANCATGSNRGYDELVPNHIHVVKETRVYPVWRSEDSVIVNDVVVTEKTGIVVARRVINELHNKLAKEGFDNGFVDQMAFDVTGVTRQRSDTHESVVTVVHNAFGGGHSSGDRYTLRVEGVVEEVIYEAQLISNKSGDNFVLNKSTINGLGDRCECYLKTGLSLSASKMVRQIGVNENGSHLEIINFPQGSVISLRFKLPQIKGEACGSIRWMMGDPVTLDTLNRMCLKMNLNDLNKALFCCEQEEQVENGGGGVYVLDSYIPPYAGLQGIQTLLDTIRPVNDLGNWLAKNLREGNWLMDYIVGRLKHREPGSHVASSACFDLGMWLETEPFAALKNVPRFLIPKYFDLICSQVYRSLLESIWAKMSPFIRRGSSFVKTLALSSVQHGAVRKSALLSPLSPNLILKDTNVPLTSLAAGLPHFSTGYMRNWGRDTFIALPGLYIITGRYEEARAIILSFAGTLRHGLIPNLLDGGKNARFNCRDAFWWWLYCIKIYVERVPEGKSILLDPVSRLYPYKDTDGPYSPLAPGCCDQPLQDVIHEGLQKHFQGIKFREWNAGETIDAHMSDEGFNISVGVNLSNGFVYGGNAWNCGTWMDKMGSSEKAGNRGKPATPRDGSAVELVGLSYATLRWLAQANKEGYYKHGSLKRVTEDTGSDITWTLENWTDKIKANFEDHFYISSNDSRSKFVNKVGIYKDVVGCSYPWCDYQLRCNFPIAMAVAPDLFSPHRALEALKISKNKLMGPLGMATLDPDDLKYKPYYDNSNDSRDPDVAHGCNYHQGPEWVWPIGFFLRAYLHFSSSNVQTTASARSEVMGIMSRHFKEVTTSKWLGLPELTNKNGSFCPDSNPTQAWSAACILEVLDALSICQPGS